MIPPIKDIERKSFDRSRLGQSEESFGEWFDGGNANANANKPAANTVNPSVYSSRMSMDNILVMARQEREHSKNAHLAHAYEREDTLHPLDNKNQYAFDFMAPDLGTSGTHTNSQI